MSTLSQVVDILKSVLGLEGEAESYSEDTALLGSLPQFDSMAVVTILTRIEEEFDIAVDDDDIDAEVFETIGSLTRFVEARAV